jgi:hypothetical protein
VNTHVYDYPYNFCDFKLSMELEPKIINIRVKKDNGDFFVYSVKFQYILLDS